MDEYPSLQPVCTAFTPPSPPLWCMSSLSSSVHSVVSLAISPLWQASYLVTVDIWAEGLIMVRVKWGGNDGFFFYQWPPSSSGHHFISGHRVYILKGKLSLLNWSTTPASPGSKWVYSCFYPLFLIPIYFFSPSSLALPHSSPPFFPKKTINTVYWKRERKTARKIKSKFLSSMNAFISFFFLPPNRGNYQHCNRHRLLTRVMAQEGRGGEVGGGIREEWKIRRRRRRGDARGGVGS